MRNGLIAACTVIAVIGYAPCLAQVGGGPSTVPSGSGVMGRDLIGQDTFNKLTEAAITAQRLTKDDKSKGKTLEQVLAEDKAAAITIAKAMPLSCDVVSAMRFAAGPETVNGQTVQTETYEAVCTNGAGYFLISVNPGAPRGFSCFAADATAKADIKAGRKPAEVCRLPDNTDLKVSASKMAAAAGIAGCKAKGFFWHGQNAAAHIEFDEVACEDGRGYMLIVALPGGQIPVQARTCNKSAEGGLPCVLSDNGVVTNSPRGFREQLAAKKIACTADDATTRVVGQQAAAKRYVVEFRCTAENHGLVGFFPTAGSTSPFEVMDCPTAAKRGVACTLPGNK